jgi:hypothetical protein
LVFFFTVGLDTCSCLFTALIFLFFCAGGLGIILIAAGGESGGSFNSIRATGFVIFGVGLIDPT